MKILYVPLALLIAAVATVATWASDDDADLASKPGYIDFGLLAADYGDPRVIVDIDRSLLRLLSALQHEDPVAEAALRNLESVRVHIYDTAGNISAATEQMAAVSKTLGDLEWDRIVKVRETDKKVDVYVKHTDAEIHGVTVMKVDGEEAVFVNVLGDINPSELSMVMDRVDMDMEL